MTDELKTAMRRSMAGAMKSLLGTGYVDDYYSSNASDFIIVAECYAADKIKAAEYQQWRGRLSWHPYTEVTVIAEHGKWLWALDDLGEPYTLRADCVERINP